MRIAVIDKAKCKPEVCSANLKRILMLGLEAADRSADHCAHKQRGSKQPAGCAAGKTDGGGQDLHQHVAVKVASGTTGDPTVGQNYASNHPRHFNGQTRERLDNSI